MRIAAIAGCLVLAGTSWTGQAGEAGEAGDAGEADGLPDALEAGWKGEKVCDLLHEDTQIRVLRCTFPPGVGHELHYHPPHFGYIEAGGTMRVTDASGSRDITSAAGHTWQSSETSQHEALNVGNTTSVALVVEKKY